MLPMRSGRGPIARAFVEWDLRRNPTPHTDPRDSALLGRIVNVGVVSMAVSVVLALEIVLFSVTEIDRGGWAVFFAVLSVVGGIAAIMWPLYTAFRDYKASGGVLER